MKRNKYFTIISIYIIIILLIFFGVDYYVGKSSLPGGEVGVLSLLILIVISVTSLISLCLTFLISFKFKIDILKSILLNQLVYLLTFAFGGLNPFISKVVFWIVLISFISQFLIIIVFLTTKLILKKK